MSRQLICLVFLVPQSSTFRVPFLHNGYLLCFGMLLPFSCQKVEKNDEYVENKENYTQTPLVNYSRYKLRNLNLGKYTRLLTIM